MRVSLPKGASMLSVEVAGAPAKPAEGADGTRVPLLRSGFRPDGPYTVSFVYLHAGPPFAKKGEMQMTLPRMDVPVTVVEWELFVPDQYRARRFAGTAIAADLVEGMTLGEAEHAVTAPILTPAVAGQIVGRVVDTTGAPIPGATIAAEVAGQHRTAVADADGRYVISELPSGPLSVSSQLPGFKTARRSLVFDQRPRQIDFQLAVGALSETVTVNAEAPVIDMRSSGVSQSMTMDEMARSNRESQSSQTGAQRGQAAQEPSMNVQSLQRRAAGVLPVQIDVPRAGASHRFIKPLVVDEETVVSFTYKRR
jgi:Carboxypeptidase regulatory-like domain